MAGMTLPHGLGALESPPDERDYILDDLYTLADASTPPPPKFDVKVLPPVYDQGTSPMCVAFSSSTVKGAEDLIELGHNYLWDRPGFFARIGGTSNGAYIRNALDRMLKVGYPLLPANSGNSQAAHRISAYYAVPKTKDSIQRAIAHFGVILIGTPWFNSWFDPDAKGNLPPADYTVGGHAIAAIGYDATGIKLRNSWGKAWGRKGDCTLPWYAALHSIREVWKAVDVVAPKETP